MLRARKVSVWRSRYEISADGRVVSVWDSSVWRSGGEFELAGRRYRMRSNAWGNRYGMHDEHDEPVASADRVGRRRWTVRAGDETYHFQRASLFGTEQQLYAGDVRVGSVRRTSLWRSEIVAELPGLPLPVQIFVLGVVICLWDQRAAAASAGGSGGG
ncbi:hypothetical protein AB0J86_31285 [Micromonospora sp. NPDC049559]|uniref:hypothetical protein n=1 Tax=Micromonospora sp. NPDC049559 TaxID=3155923 RepID=UPI0034208108